MTYKEGEIEWGKDPVKRTDFPPSFKFEKEGDEIAGIIKYIGKSKKYDTPLLHIESKDGLRTVFCSTVLAGYVDSFEVGDIVKIVYTGDFKTESGRHAKNYEVFMGAKKNEEKPKKKSKKKGKKKDEEEFSEEEIETVMEKFSVNEETAIEMLKSGINV